MEGLERIIKEHPFFAGLDLGFCALICGCAKNVRYEAGQYLFHEGEPANEFYLIRHGRVSLELHWRRSGRRGSSPRARSSASPG